MAQENGEKPAVGYNRSVSITELKNINRVILVLRLIAFLATASATVVMALNKETKTFVVATIGVAPVKATVAAKFQHTPAFVFFVIANGMGSLHSLLMIVIDVFGRSLDCHRLRLVVVAILDMLNVALVSAGANAAAFMAELGKNGNKHAKWNKICDKFESYCDHGGGALIASFIGLAFMLLISFLSILKLTKPKSIHGYVVP